MGNITRIESCRGEEEEEEGFLLSLSLRSDSLFDQQEKKKVSNFFHENECCFLHRVHYFSFA